MLWDEEEDLHLGWQKMLSQKGEGKWRSRRRNELRKQTRERRIRGGARYMKKYGYSQMFKEEMSS